MNYFTKCNAVWRNRCFNWYRALMLLNRTNLYSLLDLRTWKCYKLTQDIMWLEKLLSIWSNIWPKQFDKNICSKKFDWHNLIRGDLCAPYYRIIFELLDRLCQIIENPSFLLILQLSSFQSKIILWNDFWSSLNVILSKILKKGNFLKKTAKKKKSNSNNFLLLQL